MAESAMQKISTLVVPPTLVERADTSAGFLDLISTVAAPQTIAERVFNHRAMAAVYERAWRHSAGYILSGLTKSAERARAVAALRLDNRRRLLDVACGPGNFTRYLAGKFAADGLAVGIDLSIPMLRKAVETTADDRVGYIRADARILPFETETFDAVCCFAALYLIPEPYQVLDEMIRVLAPGGRIAILTSCTRGPMMIQSISTTLARRQGAQAFGRTDITAVLDSHGFGDIDQQVRGLSQFVSATKPTG